MFRRNHYRRSPSCHAASRSLRIIGEQKMTARAVSAINFPPLVSRELFFARPETSKRRARKPHSGGQSSKAPLALTPWLGTVCKYALTPLRHKPPTERPRTNGKTSDPQ